MITIGVDPGIERIGVGVVEQQGSRFILRESRLIKTSSKLTTPERLLIINNELSEIAAAHPITFASVEKLFFAKNIKTAMTVSEARGVILLTLQQQGIPIYEYTPLQVKQALLGYGRATKKQIQEMVKVILKSDELIKQDDVADGIALAITHFNTYKTIKKYNLS